MWDKERECPLAPFCLRSIALSQKFHYGGQALVKGVMIRGQRHFAVALRRPNGDIATFVQPVKAIYSGGLLRRIPLVRGLIAVADSLILGFHILLYSAEEAKVPSRASLWVWLGLGVILALGLFLALPLLGTWGLDHFITSAIVSNVVDGVIRLAIFIIYLKAISLIPEVRRLFTYHGAEHKVVNAYEDGAALEIEAVKGYSTAHARCGTALILAVLIIAIIAFAFLGREALWLRFLQRLALFPFIIATSYELTQFGARHIKSWASRAMLAPGLALQALTAREPDEGQLEVAISALKGAIDADAE
jgi:hypothetical protein